MKTNISLDGGELETLKNALEYAIAYAKEGAQESYHSMDRRDVTGFEIEIQRFTDLATRLGMKLE